MLKLMRDSFQHLKWILIVVIGLFVALVFVDWGGAGRTGGGVSDLGAAAVRVDGEAISFGEYRRALYFMERRFEQAYGQQMNDELRRILGIEQRVLTELVNDHILLREAARMNLAATEGEIRKAILDVDDLNPGGEFVGSELYERYVTSLGFSSAADYERVIARDLTLSKMRSALASSIAIAPAEVEAEYRRQKENATIQFVYLPNDKVEEGIEVSPEETEGFYSEHSNRYGHGEQRRVRYLIADLAQTRAGLRIEDEELETYYDRIKGQYQTGESVRASHILIPLSPDAGEEIQAAARQRAEDLVAQLRGGADFAELAKATSSDPGSAALGGDVGFFERGAMVPEFEQAAFSLPIGDISDPVKTQFGYHILKVTEKRDTGFKPLDEVRVEVSTQFLDEKALNMARDAVASARARVVSEKPTAEAGLRAIADATQGVALNDTQWFERNDSIFGIGRSEALAGWAFAAAVGEVSAVFETTRGPIVGWLDNSREAGISELSEVRAVVEADALQAKTAEQAREQLASAVLEGTLESVAEKFELTVQDATVSRGGTIPTLTGNVEPVVNAAFAGMAGAIAGPVAIDQGAVLLNVKEQMRFDPAVFESEKDQFVDTLRREEANKLVGALLDKLRGEADIVYNDALLPNATPGV